MMLQPKIIAFTAAEPWKKKTQKMKECEMQWNNIKLRRHIKPKTSLNYFFFLSVTLFIHTYNIDIHHVTKIRLVSDYFQEKSGKMEGGKSINVFYQARIKVLISSAAIIS